MSQLIVELRRDCVLLEQMCIFAEIQCTKHFIGLLFVETNEMVPRSVHEFGTCKDNVAVECRLLT